MIMSCSAWCGGGGGEMTEGREGEYIIVLKKCRLGLRK